MENIRITSCLWGPVLASFKVCEGYGNDGWVYLSPLRASAQWCELYGFKLAKQQRWCFSFRFTHFGLLGEQCPEQLENRIETNLILCSCLLETRKQSDKNNIKHRRPYRSKSFHVWRAGYLVPLSVKLCSVLLVLYYHYSQSYEIISISIKLIIAADLSAFVVHVYLIEFIDLSKKKKKSIKEIPTNNL